MAGKPKVRRRLRAVIIGTIVLGLIGGGLYAYRWQRIQKRYADLRVEGMAAVAVADHVKVVELLGPYLQRFPSDVEALSGYARSRPLVTTPNGQHILETIQVLRYLLKLEPSRIIELRALLDMYAQTGFVTETLETADAVLKADPSNIRAIELRARSLLQLRRPTEALLVADQWIGLAPDQYDADLVAIQAMIQLGQSKEEILARTAARLAQNVGDPRFELVHGMAHGVMGDKSGSLTHLRNAALRYRASLLIERLARNSTTAIVARVVMDGPFQMSAPLKDPTFGLTLIDWLDRSDATIDSLAVLEDIARRPVPPPSAAVSLGLRYWELGRWKEAAENLKVGTGTSRHPDSELIGLRSLALAYSGQLSEAAVLRKGIAARKDDPLAAAWSVLIVPYVEPSAASATSELLIACQQALALHPDRPYLYHYLGEAYARIGEFDAAIRCWRQSAERTSSWSTPLVRTAEMLANAGRYDAAQSVALQAQMRGIHSVEDRVVMLRVVSSCIESGRMTETPLLQEQIERIQAAAPGEESTLAVQVGLLARSAKPDDRNRAFKALAAAIASDSKFTKAGLLRLASISQTSRLDLEDECFDRVERDFGMSADLAYARAASQFAAGNPKQGLERLDAARKSAADSKPEWDAARVMFLELIGDPSAADAIVQLGDSHPSNLGIQQLALRSRAAQSNKDFTARTIERLKGMTGNQALGWQVARARWLLRFGASPEATSESLAILTRALKESPESLEIRLLLAETLKASGDTSGAVEQLTTAVNVDPDSALAAMRLIHMLQTRGDYERAREHLDRLAGKRIADPEQRRRAAGLLAQQGNTQRAIELLQEGTGEDDLLLAALYRVRNQTSEVQVILDRRLPQPDIRTLVFAADFYASNGRREMAAQCLAQLDQLKLEPGEKQLCLADFAAKYESREAAVKLYRSAASAATSPELKSRAWIAIVADLVAVGKAEDALLAVEAGLAAVPQDGALLALQRLRSVLVGALRDPRLRTFAVVILRDPANRPAAIELLEQVTSAAAERLSIEQMVARIASIAHRNPVFIPLHALLADEYLRMNRPDQAATVASNAMQAAPGSIEATRLLCEVLLASNRWNEALVAGRKWRELTPAVPLQADLAIARAHIGLDQHANVIELLTPYFQSVQASPEHQIHPQVASLFAMALEKSGKFKEASTLVEPLLKRDVRWRQTWAAFVVESLTELRASAWLDELIKLTPEDSSPKEHVVIAESFSRLAIKFNRPAYADRARSILRSIANKPNPSAIAVLAYGMRLEQDGSMVEAEKLYRNVLSTVDPGPEAEMARTLSRNNLAMLLARQNRNPDEAIRLAALAAAAHRDKAEFQDTLAFVFSASGNHDAAAKAAARAASLQPDEPRYHVQHARILVAAGKLDAAAGVLAALEERFAGLTRLPEAMRREVNALRNTILKRDGSSSRVPQTNSCIATLKQRLLSI